MKTRLLLFFFFPSSFSPLIPRRVGRELRTWSSVFAHSCTPRSVLLHRSILEPSPCICTKLSPKCLSHQCLKTALLKGSAQERAHGDLRAGLTRMSQFPRRLRAHDFIALGSGRLIAETFPSRKINDSGSRKSGSCMFMVSQVKRRAGQEVHGRGLCAG